MKEKIVMGILILVASISLFFGVYSHGKYTNTVEKYDTCNAAYTATVEDMTILQENADALVKSNEEKDTKIEELNKEIDKLKKEVSKLKKQ